MPLVEQLRFKQNEAHARLQSRKRKLHELYSATINSGDHQVTTQYELYSPPLHVFLDLNDLEKGRKFDESTLPPRPQISRLAPHERSSRTREHSIDPTSNVRPTKLSAKHASTLSPRPINGTTPVQTPVSRSSTPAASKQTRKASPHDVTGDGMIDPEYIEEVETPRMVSLLPASDALNVQENETAQELGEGGILSSIHDGDARPTLLDDLQSASTSAAVLSESISLGGQVPDSLVSVPDQNSRSRSPLVLAPLAAPADPQSSPASTSAPGSSNTPAPTAGSPTTSPGDEDHPIKDLDFPAPLAENPSIFLGGDTSRYDKPMTELDDHVTMKEESKVAHEARGAPGDPLGPTSNQNLGSSVSRKPTMRIDTQSAIDQFFKPRTSGSVVESPAPVTNNATPRRTPAPTIVQDQPKRATRISSGALQKKSVSEILGETPKTASPHNDSPSSSMAKELGANGRSLDVEKRDKERTKLSTVLFAKPQRSSDASDTIELVRRTPGASEQTLPKERDYLYSLFESRAYSPPKNTSLSSLIHEARKTLSTSDHAIDYREQMNCRAMKRIYQLQNANRWPLRQLKRAEEMARPTSHWDFVLDHAKWLRTDFREERKWKLAAAKAVAEWCQEWSESRAEERTLLQVRSRTSTLRASSAQENLETGFTDGLGATMSAQPTPDLVPSAEDDSVSDGVIPDPRDLALTDVPAAIFSLGPSDFAFKMDKTPASDKLLNELPLYEPASIEPDMAKSDIAERLDARWKQDIVPISRFAREKICSSDAEPPRKRTRYSYSPERMTTKRVTPMPPRQVDVALFQPENKHMRDRIHPGHSFRPPSEHPMPTQGFFESRQSSQWTHTEDDELRRIVREYSYNWSLISDVLKPSSEFASGADRRTPWECFERWIGLEGLPADMSKTPYFRAYHSRIEAAGRHVQAQLEAAQQRAGPNVQVNRKRTTQPVRVERKRTQKHLAMIDAMRKSAKKRETAIQKAQHQSDLAAMRKANEANQPKPPITTPAEFARLKHEREIKMAERQEAYRQQLIAHQRATAQQQRGQPGQAPGASSGAPRNTAALPNGPTSATGIAGMPNGNLAVPPGHQRPHSMQGMPNGIPPGVPLPPGMMGPKAAQAQMQAHLMAQAAAARGMGSSPENQQRILEQARNIQQQQLLAQRQAQVVTNGVHSSPNLPNAAMVNGNGVNNPSYLGASSPSMQVDGVSASPRTQNALNSGQALSNGQIPVVSQISANLRLQFPQMPEEQILNLTNQQLRNYSQAQATNAAAGGQQKQRNFNQAALNAAMGAVNSGAHASNLSAAAAAAAAQAAAAGGYGGGMMTNEQVQQYNQRMRAQQAAQRATGGFPPGAGGPMGAGMIGSSPVMNMARPVSQQGMHAQAQGQLSRSATPRERGGSVNGGPGQKGNHSSPRGQQPIVQS